MPVGITEKAKCENIGKACIKKEENGSNDCVSCPSAKHNKGKIRAMPTGRHNLHQRSARV